MNKIIFSILILIVVAIGLLHFFTPGHLVFYHDTYRRLSYFPIVFAAVWFGVPGGIAIAVLSSIFFIPHLLLYMGGPPEMYLSEITEVLLYLAAGTVTGFIVSREARLREKYRALSEKLKASYEKLHRETELLIEAEEHLSASEKLSALGRLSASLAHEIKNPLSSIKGTAQILLDEFPAEHPKREFVEILLKETDRLNATVDDVLRYSRGGAVAGDDNSAPRQPLSDCIEQVVRLVDTQRRKKAISLNTEGLDSVRDLAVDGGRLSQVFLNIILNAFDAVPRQGIIHIRAESRAEGVSVTITDNGPGIAGADKDRIFTPFYSDKEDGTGLGLAISRKIVESFGGSLTLQGTGPGASFVVFLPAGTPVSHTKD